MQRFWKAFYGVMSLLLLVQGFQRIGGLPHIDFDHTLDVFGERSYLGPLFIFGGFIVAMGVFGQLGVAVVYALRRSGEALRYPSWDRAPFDMLQTMRIFTIGMALMLAGASVRMLCVGWSGMMLFVPLAGVALGAFLGERLFYLVNRKRIVRWDEEIAAPA